MPRGGHRGSERQWIAEWDDHLRLLMAPLDHPPYSELAVLMNEKFGMGWTRNAILGRANRLGLRSKNKPHGYVGMRRKKKNKPKEKLIRFPKNRPVVVRTNLVLENPRTVRSNENAWVDGRIGEKRRGRISQAELELRRMGTLPEIIEETPRTSKPFLESDRRECKWPTTDSLLCMEVCGQPATFGSYCDKHGAIAYRLGPTRKRQACFHKEQNEHALRLELPSEQYSVRKIEDVPLLSFDGDQEFDDV